MTATALFLTRTDSPIGRLELTSDGPAITSLAIEREGRLPFDAFPVNSNAVLDEAVRQLGQYFAGERLSFDLPIHAEGTPFQKKVWEVIAALPYGEYTSYGEIGLEIGIGPVGRAVGGAVGANPVPIIVPCHRVLSSQGRVTGYSGGEGIPTKLWLLRHEGITLAA